MPESQASLAHKSIETSWQAIVDVEQELQQVARVENWSEVKHIAQQRHVLVTKHFQQHPVSPNNAEFYFTRLNNFLLQEQKLSKIVNIARKKVIKAVGGINHKRQAISAYNSIC